MAKAFQEVDSFIAPPPLGKLKWYAIDFDGTIATSTWSIDNPNAKPGPPLEGVRFKLWEIWDSGNKIAVHTARSYADFNIIEAYMYHYDLPFNRIFCGKLLAHVYIDDRNKLISEKSWL